MTGGDQQVADGVDAQRTAATRAVVKVALFAAKVVVTALCFWYLSRRIDVAQLLRVLPELDVRWAAVAALVAMLQIPLLGLRWCEILDALALRNARMTRAAVIGITAIGAFFTQVLPNIAGDGMRVWLAARLGCDWRAAC